MTSRSYGNSQWFFTFTPNNSVLASNGNLAIKKKLSERKIKKIQSGESQLHNYIGSINESDECEYIPHRHLRRVIRSNETQGDREIIDLDEYSSSEDVEIVKELSNINSDANNNNNVNKQINKEDDKKRELEDETAAEIKKQAEELKEKFRSYTLNINSMLDIDNNKYYTKIVNKYIKKYGMKYESITRRIFSSIVKQHMAYTDTDYVEMLNIGRNPEFPSEDYVMDIMKDLSLANSLEGLDKTGARILAKSRSFFVGDYIDAVESIVRCITSSYKPGPKPKPNRRKSEDDDGDLLLTSIRNGFYCVVERMSNTIVDGAYLMRIRESIPKSIPFNTDALERINKAVNSMSADFKSSKALTKRDVLILLSEKDSYRFVDVPMKFKHDPDVIMQAINANKIIEKGILSIIRSYSSKHAITDTEMMRYISKNPNLIQIVANTQSDTSVISNIISMSNVSKLDGDDLVNFVKSAGFKVWDFLPDNIRKTPVVIKAVLESTNESDQKLFSEELKTTIARSQDQNKSQLSSLTNEISSSGTSLTTTATSNSNNNNLNETGYGYKSLDSWKVQPITNVNQPSDAMEVDEGATRRTEYNYQEDEDEDDYFLVNEAKEAKDAEFLSLTDEELSKKYDVPLLYVKKIRKTRVFLRNDGINDAMLEKIARLILDVQRALDNRHIDTLDISGNVITGSALESIAKCNIFSLIIHHNLVDDKGLSYLESAIKSKNIGSLDIRYNKITDKGATIIARAFAGCRRDEYLFIAEGNNIEKKDFSEDIVVIDKNKIKRYPSTDLPIKMYNEDIELTNEITRKIYITRMDKGNGVPEYEITPKFPYEVINPIRFKKIIEYIKNKVGTNSIINYISLTYTGFITDDMLQELSGLDIREMELEGKYITDAGAVMIASNFPKLKNLSLKGCFIGDEGARAISTLKDLEFLNLSFCRIGDDGARYLANNKYPEYINISDNYDITREGIMAFIDSKFKRNVNATNLIAKFTDNDIKILRKSAIHDKIRIQI